LSFFNFTFFIKKNRFRTALKTLLAAANPYASNSDEKTEVIEQDDGSATDCCICIGAIAPYQALFISPCSHCFHFKVKKVYYFFYQKLKFKKKLVRFSTGYSISYVSMSFMSTSC
jgi:hypothetical protein